MKNTSEKNNSLTVLQLSDMHLHFENTRLLQGYATNQRFDKLIDHIIERESIKPDVIFLTGDISQDMLENSYVLCAKLIEKLNINTYWIAGNHDDPKVATEIFSKSKIIKPLLQFETEYWDFIFINSCRAETDKGYITPQEIERVIKKLEIVGQTKSVCLVMHHHPIPVFTPLVDECILQEGDVFLDRIKNYSSVKLIMCGHVHGDYSLTFAGINIESAPATCFQWKKGTNSLETQDISGYAIYRMEKNAFTKIVRKINRIENNENSTVFPSTL